MLDIYNIDSGTILSDKFVVLGRTIRSLDEFQRQSKYYNMYGCYLYYCFQKDKYLDYAMEDLNLRPIVTTKDLMSTVYMYLLGSEHLVVMDEKKDISKINAYNLKIKLLTGTNIYTNKDIKEVIRRYIKESQYLFEPILNSDIHCFLSYTEGMNIKGLDELESLKTSNAITSLSYIEDFICTKKGIQFIKERMKNKRAKQIFEEILINVRRNGNNQ